VDAVIRRRAQRGEHHAAERGQRVGRRGERDVVVGQRATRQVAAPDDRVERVVVDEAAPGERPRERTQEGDDAEAPRAVDGHAAAQ
jgi:hypothetical protein